MYTVNPLGEKGMAASGLTSTHPPTSERIRILRAMAGASVADYEFAYRKVKRSSGVIPASVLAGAGSLSIRSASPEAGPAEESVERIKRTRDTSDVMWRLGNYKTLVCECGTRFRVPPSYRDTEVKCPHCGRVNQL